MMVALHVTSVPRGQQLSGLAPALIRPGADVISSASAVIRASLLLLRTLSPINPKPLNPKTPKLSHMGSLFPE